MSFNTPRSTFDYNRHVVVGFRGRSVKVRDTVYSRLVEMAEDDDDCDFARWLLLQVCEIFRDEIDAQTAAGPWSADEREYLAGWKDALTTVCGLSSLCLKGPLEDEGLFRPESPGESSHEGTKESCQGGFARGRDEEWEGLTRRNEEYEQNSFGDTVSSSDRDNQQEDSCSQPSQASSSLIKTPSTVSISDSVLHALFPSSSSAHSLPSIQVPSTRDSRKRDEHDRNLNKSDIIRGLETTALLTHFERQSRLSERRIAAELGRTSILRQAILQDRFFGRVPSFAGIRPANGEVPRDDDEDEDDYDTTDVTDEINDPFLGEAQQMRAVRQVKTLFRQWRKAAAESCVEDDEASGEGVRAAKQERNSDDLSDDSVVSSNDPEPWLKGHGGDAPPPSPGSESVYSSDSVWPSAAGGFGISLGTDGFSRATPPSPGGQ